LSFILPALPQAHDLDGIKKDGVLRHIGVHYAAFVTGCGDGLDVEIIQGFAAYLGVKYQFVKSSWSTLFGDLTGKNTQKGLQGADILKAIAVKGDVIASGITILPWRSEIIAFSNPTFPTSVWLVSSAESSLQPVKPSGSVETDINYVKSLLKGHSLLAMKNTCLDPALYNLRNSGVEIRFSNGRFDMNELAPAVFNHAADATLLDVPDALIALQKWPGKIKVIGPVSKAQQMGVCFRKDSPRLRQAFNRYLEKIKKDGSYAALVRKYYPSVFHYYPDFFTK